MSDAGGSSSDDRSTETPATHARFHAEAGDRYVVHVAGELDADTVGDLKVLFDDAFGAEPTTIVIDMSALEFVDSMGLGVLVTSHNRAAEAGIGFEIHDLPDSCRRVFEITNLLEVLDLR
jgi:anti-sigma B factor antagonist